MLLALSAIEHFAIRLTNCTNVPLVPPLYNSSLYMLKIASAGNYAALVLMNS